MNVKNNFGVEKINIHLKDNITYLHTNNILEKKHRKINESEGKAKNFFFFFFFFFFVTTAKFPEEFRSAFFIRSNIINIPYNLCCFQRSTSKYNCIYIYASLLDDLERIFSSKIIIIFF